MTPDERLRDQLAAQRAQERQAEEKRDRERDALLSRMFGGRAAKREA